MKKDKIIKQIKYNRILRFLYTRVGSLIMSVARYLVRTNTSLIVFCSFAGRKFDDSPRCIYEAMISDPRFTEYRMVWLFNDELIDKIALPRGKKVKANSVEAFLLLLKARVWISDSRMTHRLSFRGKHTFYLNTWHGSAIKTIGDAQHNDIIEGRNFVDAMIVQSEYDVRVFRRDLAKCLNAGNAEFYVVGLPRNDALVHENNAMVKKDLRSRLGIPEHKQVILYAPTYRDYNISKDKDIFFEIPIHWELWREVLGEGFVVLFRGHSAVSKFIGIHADSFIYDVTQYPVLNDLILVSDMLVSDYSSIFFDYSITGKPMLCYAYDYEIYAAKRGVYFDIREELQCANIVSEEDLLNEVATINPDERKAISQNFCNKYVQAYGQATSAAVDIVWKNIQ